MYSTYTSNPDGIVGRMPKECKMFKFFRNAVVSSPESSKAVVPPAEGFNSVAPQPESHDDRFKREQRQKNEVVQRLIKDFPWLWAIKNYYSSDYSKYIKVSQDLADLKIVLAQLSGKTKFLVWVISSQYCEAFNMRATCLDSQGDRKWCEAIMQQTHWRSDIHYLVTVDESACGYMSIFRHPEKEPLNKVIEQVSQLLGSDVRWLT